MEKPNYFAVIPASVRYDENLKMGEKLMYGEITALTNKTGECWASNNYFAELYKVTPQAISKWIKNLEKNNYIIIEYDKQGKMIEKRIIKMVSTDIDRVSTTVEGGINQSLEGYQPEIKENNTSINNTSINNKKKVIKEKYFENEEVNDLFYEFLEFRKKLKAVNNDKAITLLINKLKDFDDSIKIKMINQSIENSWKSVFPLKKEYKKKENGYDIINRIIREEKEKNGKN